jgi:hypothetical protein
VQPCATYKGYKETNWTKGKEEERNNYRTIKKRVGEHLLSFVIRIALICDECVPFSFTYPPFSFISSAILTLTLTPKDKAITSDAIAIVDNPQGLQLIPDGLKTQYVVFGNEELRDLPVDQQSTVSFDRLSATSLYSLLEFPTLPGLHLTLHAPCSMGSWM